MIVVRGYILGFPSHGNYHLKKECIFAGRGLGFRLWGPELPSCICTPVAFMLNIIVIIVIIKIVIVIIGIINNNSNSNNSNKNNDNNSNSNNGNNNNNSNNSNNNNDNNSNSNNGNNSNNNSNNSNGLKESHAPLGASVQDTAMAGSFSGLGFKEFVV